VASRSDSAGRQPRRGQPNPYIVVGALVVVGLLVGSVLALTQAPRPSAAPTATPTGEAGSLPPPETGTPGPAQSASAGNPGSSDAGSGSPSVRIDPSLLAILPSDIGGLTVSEDPQTEALDASDPSHATDLAAIARAVVASPSTNDLGVASVVRLQPGIVSDAYFRSWRETFDAGVCSQAGGVGGSAEATIGGRQAFVGHCTGGVLTYHVYLPDRNVIVSVMSLGDQRLGEKLIEGIR
jgi:hypothetical protein